MRLRLTHTTLPPPRGLRAGFLACMCFLLALFSGEVLLRAGVGRQLGVPVLVSCLLAVGLVLAQKLYPPPRFGPYWRSVALALLAVAAWLCVAWKTGTSPGMPRSIATATCVLMVMVSVFRASPTLYAGLAALAFGASWVFIRDLKLSALATGVVVAVLLVMELLVRRLMQAERSRAPAAPTTWNLEPSPPLNPRTTRAGFLVSCCMLASMAVGETMMYHGVALSLYTLALAALLGMWLSVRMNSIEQSRLLKQAFIAVGGAWLIWLMWTLLSGGPIGLFNTILLAIMIVFVTVAVFRAPANWFATASLVIVALVAVTTRDLLITITMAAAIAALLVVLNYGVQLVLDHERELRLLALHKAPSLQIAGKSAAVLMIPAFVLVALGMAANVCLQNWLIQAPYSDDTWPGDQGALVHWDCRVGPKGLDELEQDLNCSIDRWEEQARDRASVYVQGTTDDVKRLSGQTPEAVAKQVMKLRPATIDGRVACHGFRETYEVLSASFEVTFTSGCRELITHVNRALTENHDKMAAAINNAVTKGSADVDAAIATHTEEFKQGVDREITRSADDAREANRKMFIALRLLQLISWLVLAISLLAAYQMLIGRIVFDQKTSNSLTFRLAKPHKIVAPLDATVHHVLNLAANLPSKTARPANATRWFVSLGMARRGIGSSMDITRFLPGVSPFQRLITGTYFTTAIDVVPSAGTPPATAPKPPQATGPIRPGIEPTEPALSVAGDHCLVRIELKDGQQVGFRLSDLVAWTEHVTLRARYTTHIGTSLLKLGSFCTIAEGGEPDVRVEGAGRFGYIVLRSEGVVVSTSQAGTTSPVSNLLAWDNSQEFALDQRLHPWKVWFNEPSVTTEHAADAVLLDEGRTSQWPLLERIGNLFRYFLLPI